MTTKKGKTPAVYHVRGTEDENKTACGKTIEPADGKRPAVLLAASVDRKGGGVCNRCKAVVSGHATPSDGKAAKSGRGIGELAKKLLREGKGVDDVIAGVHAAFPSSKISRAAVSWYKQRL